MPTERSTVRMAYADTPDGQVHYAEAGEGFPLLLLSATPRTHRCYLRLMALLAPYCRPIAVDMPGFGNSHDLPQPLKIERIARCMSNFLDALDIGQTDVFGLHTGNKLAAALAADYPQRIRRLVLAGQSHSIIPEVEERNKAIQPWFDKYKNHYLASSDGSNLVRDWLNAQINASEIWWPKAMLHSAVVSPNDVENAEARIIDFVQGWRSCVPVYEAVMAYDLAAAYGRIKVPTMILELLTAQEKHIGGQASRICSLIAGAVVAQLTESDGLALEMRPQEFAAAILPFLYPAAGK
ncbi:AB hydrolase superfamily protein YvaM [Variovorax sp. PBL-H6]|uniref:alpha/beta fold hydrolase n=1 Tax=Variovorax sp. PBL-H6 TaxID=434009 RepID=UPI00131842ED|nr:alpha/beta hydrolase [Variovorax sp. PBL-H6]VTU33557.1 AB hydrolase superfamily protein YvaM [Variovorax sp. PBL-H6]